eukprot:403899-Amphidinium_carterae.1
MEPRPNLQLLLAFTERRPDCTKQANKRNLCQVTLVERHYQPEHCHADQAPTPHAEPRCAHQCEL